MLSPQELELVDDFRFRKRMPSRASAVRELLRRGLAAEGSLSQNPAGSRSSLALPMEAQETDEDDMRTGRRLLSSSLRLPKHIR